MVHALAQKAAKSAQRTLKSPLSFEGVGLHSGAPARLVLRPAPAGHGIWVRRSDAAGQGARMPVRWDMVEQTPLCTRLVTASGVSVSTVEHVMAALAGCGVHNALIEVDGPEIPILDGSSAPFVEAILRGGLVAQSAPVRALEILEEVRFEGKDGWAMLTPAPVMEMNFTIDFPDAAIGRQSKSLTLANGAFVRELCDSRTFCRNAEVDAMRAQGLALGGTLENAVVVDGAEVLSPGGLRHADEAVRHKMLDALGDLALAGAPILGCYTGYKAGHNMTNSLLRQLFATPGAVRLVTCDAAQAARLPGIGAALAEMPAVA